MSASDKKKLRKEQKVAAMTEKQLNEQKQIKKLKTYTITFVVVMILVVSIVIGVTLRSPVNSMINQNTHAITFGEHELSTVDFSYYYISAINQYCDEVYSTYAQTLGNYWAMFLGFNVGEPLDEQMYDEEKNITWAQWFVDEAIEDAKKSYAIYEQALANNHKLTEAEQKELDNLETSLTANAEYYGYSSVNEYLRIYYGDGANVENFKNYYTVSTYVTSYVTAYADSLEYTDDEVREYEKDKFLNYTTFDYCYYLINVNSYLGEGTKDENGNVTYTDQQKADALAAAKKDAESFNSANVTDSSSFNTAIKALEINKDKKDASCVQGDDVFYEDLAYAELKDWLSKDGRKDKDFEVVTLTSTTGEGEDAKEEIVGYMIVLFQGRDDCYTNLVSVRHILAEFPTLYDNDGNIVLTEADKARIKKEAEELLKEWQDGDATEESFAELANKKSDDGDGTTGGLYEDIWPSQMVDGFSDWCFDEARKPGDVDIVETTYGYHVMYFVETEEETYRDAMIKVDMTNDELEEWVEAHTKALKVEQINLKGLEWDYIVN